MAAFLASGSLPAGTIEEDKIDEKTVDGQLYAAWNATVAADAVGHYLDWAAPGFYDVLVQELQGLVTGTQDAAATNANLGKKYDEGTADFR